jgi:hypothetical protein
MIKDNRRNLESRMKNLGGRSVYALIDVGLFNSGPDPSTSHPFLPLQERGLRSG